MINTYKEVNTMDQQIVIKAYQKDWVEEYIKEKEKFCSLLGQEIIAVEHIGSTAVEGLGAKPLIDMMIGVTDLQITENWIEVISEIGYEYVPKIQPIGVFLERENGERVLIICIFIFIIVMSGETIFYFVTF